jgi:hypothetical protein
MEVIQLNMNHCKLAQDLLWQNMAESCCNVALVSDPHKNPLNGMWVSDKNNSAAISVSPETLIQEVVSSDHEGFVVTRIRGVYFCSCYAPPRWTIDEFEEMLDALVKVVLGKTPIVIGGDFNAWAMEWGSRTTNQRGQSFLEAMARLDVCIANCGSMPTFQKNGGESIIDVTLLSPSLISKAEWKVTNEYTGSDHHMIRFKVDTGKPRAMCNYSSGVRWKTKNLNEGLLCASFGLATRNKGVLLPTELTLHVIDACDMSMPRQVAYQRQRKSAFWWNDDIAACRAKCIKARRRAQRARTDILRSEYSKAYKLMRKQLKIAIRTSKKEKFKELCEEVDTNPWGLGYKNAMAKLKGQSFRKETCPVKLKGIVETLFPKHDETGWANQQHSNGRVVINRESPISNSELIDIAKKLKPRKAPGPDGIPNEALKILVKRFPSVFRDTLQKCLDDCIFPDIWKKQKLVLLPKPSKAGDTNAYRPICLLDSPGKLLEAVILRRLTAYTEASKGLSNKQHGFRRGRSTSDAIKSLVNVAQQAIDTPGRIKTHCAITTIDVKNAFNSASWEIIVKSLKAIGASNHICSMIESYLSNRVLMYDTDKGPVSREVTAGVPQGSILGPILWNIMYDPILKLNLPVGVDIVGFADDIVISVIHNSVESIQYNIEYALRTIGDWLKFNKLEMAHHKTEFVVVTKKRQPITTQVSVGGNIITSSRKLRYLGIIIDDRLSFTAHVGYACEKAARVNTALASLMPNTFGPRSSKRKLLANVTTSILTYSCETWKKALEKETNLIEINKVHRLSAIRVACAYRTISYEAACVIAGLVPIKIVTERLSDRKQSIDVWQREWESSTKGRWTYTLIPNIQRWLDREYGEVDYYVTQFLSGHGGFGEYLHNRVGKLDSSLCGTCGVDETPQHLLFECEKFNEARNIMRGPNRLQLSPNNLIEYMCESSQAWNTVALFMKDVLVSLEAERVGTSSINV